MDVHGTEALAADVGRVYHPNVDCRSREELVAAMDVDGSSDESLSPIPPVHNPPESLDIRTPPRTVDTTCRRAMSESEYRSLQRR